MRLVYITLGWISGMLVAYSADYTSTLWLGMAAIFVLFVIFTWRDPDYRILNIAFLAFALGGLRYSFVATTSEIAVYNNTDGLTIEGVIVAEPDIRDTQIQLRVRVERVIRGGEETISGGLVLVRAPRNVDARYGDLVAATGLLITPAQYDTFSYADYLARSGVFSIMDNSSIEVISGGHGSAFYRLLYDVREQVSDKIAQNLPEPQAGLLTGILLGNQRGISPDLNDDFSRVGASHIIAISGFNMVIISGVVMGSFRRIFRQEWVAAGLGIGVIALYTLFVGANAAVMRAAVMSSLLVIGEALKRKTYVPASLAFVTLMMSLQNPNVLWDISFQLSLFATLGLALFVDPLQTRFRDGLMYLFPAPFARRLNNFLSEALIVTLAAQITTLPLIILYFNRLSLVTFIVNLLVVPAQTILMIVGGLATLVVFIIPLLGQLLYWADLVVLSWTIGVVRVFAALPFADVEFRVGQSVITIYFVMLLGWALMHATQPNWWLQLGRLIKQQMILTAVAFSGGALVILMGTVAFSRPDGRLHIWMLDMGHSDAVLIQTPGGAQILIDGGRFPSRLLTAIGDHLPFTDREIEVLVLTQPDEFDLSALSAVFERYDAGIVLTNGQPNLADWYAQLQESLAGEEILTVSAGYSVDLDDGTRLEVLHPQQQPDLNDPIDDHALVLRLTYGDISFLFTSDLSREGQRALLEAGQWPLATVMQLPQHATARSLDEGFLAAAQPQAVVVQIDSANRRGDPNEELLAMVRNTPLFRTDISGTLHLWTDGEALRVESES